MKHRIALILAIALTAGCTTTQMALDRADELGTEAVGQRQDLADKELRWHLAHLCMANYDSLLRILNLEQLEAMVVLCQNNNQHGAKLLPPAE